MKDSDSKTALFDYISDDLQSKTREKPYILFTTKGCNVLSSKDEINLNDLDPCTQEEPDTRIFLHLKNMLENGHKHIFILTGDTDIVGIAIDIFHRLQNLNLQEIWIGFGSGENLRLFLYTILHSNLGPKKAEHYPYSYHSQAVTLHLFP